jgi:hypothetical protein
MTNQTPNNRKLHSGQQPFPLNPVILIKIEKNNNESSLTKENFRKKKVKGEKKNYILVLNNELQSQSKHENSTLYVHF